ncbi:MAG: HAD-IB family phosphatase [Chloroflexota bacterium]
MKTLVQCDFDGTVTEEDVSFLLLDAFANGDWRKILQEYKDGRISVGQFNARSFSLVEASEATLTDYTLKHARLRPGFRELVAYCRQRHHRIVIVSNGLDFYIRAILRHINEADIEVHASQTRFLPRGLTVRYLVSDGQELETGFKDWYADLFLGQGYRLVYLGNGFSDVSPARRAHLVFATGDLPAFCNEAHLDCVAFNDFAEVRSTLEARL